MSVPIKPLYFGCRDHRLHVAIDGHDNDALMGRDEQIEITKGLETEGKVGRWAMKTR
jgi:hypothetical protein